MYRCYLCKEPVTKKEHRETKRIFGGFTEDEIAQTTRDLGEDDLFDEEGHVVICRNCVFDAELEVEELVMGMEAVGEKNGLHNH